MAPTDGSGPAPADTLLPLEGDGSELLGTVVDGRYRLEATLGRGGMGLVFRATHVGLRRQVAVKILHPSLATSPDVRNRFEREALAVGKVDHPNCVATYDVGRLPDGSLYLAMELLDGQSLADVLEREGQLAPGRALHILAHILRGLGSIHAAGLIHRDIKPENVFLIRQGEDVDFAKILDFGIAKPMSGELSDDGVRLTQAGMAFGTPIYMAPEQALGNKLDGRADIYAAAVVAYEMLAGQPPFYSEDKLEVMSMHTAKAVPAMRSRLIKHGKPVPASIERIIVKGLTKKTVDRYQTAEAFLARVEDALHTVDGGVTVVNFQRLGGGDTGSHPLVDDAGDLDFAERTNAIAAQIDEILDDTSPPLEADTHAGTKVMVAPLPAAPDSGKLVVAAPNATATATPPPRRKVAKAPKQRWPLYAGILGIALGAGTVVAVVTAPNKNGDTTLASGTAFPTPDPILKEAQDALATDPVRAIQIIEANKATLGKNADAQLLAAQAHMVRHESNKALAAYRAALELSSAAAENETLRRDLRRLSTDRNNEVAIGALDLWFGRTADTTNARDAIVKAATGIPIERRHLALKLVDQYKLTELVDWLTVYTYDLEQEASCERRKEAVEKLRALGNPKALHVLELAVAKRNLKKNACLLVDARAGIAALTAIADSRADGAGSASLGSGSAVIGSDAVAPGSGL